MGSTLAMSWKSLRLRVTIVAPRSLAVAAMSMSLAKPRLLKQGLLEEASGLEQLRCDPDRGSREHAPSVSTCRPAAESGAQMAAGEEKSGRRSCRKQERPDPV